MKQKLAKALRLMKSELSDDASAMAVALQEAIAEAESSEKFVEADELATIVRDIVRDKLPELVETPEVANAISRVSRQIGAATGKSESYLASKTAARDYLAAISNSHSALDYSRNWSAKLAENGITGLTAPTLVSGAIETAWGVGNGLVAALRHVANGNFTIQYSELDGWQQLARGHKKGESKEAQVLEVSPKQLILQGIYKDQYVDRVDLAAMQDDATFLQWLAEELSERLAFTIEAQIISGGNTPQTSIHALVNGSYDAAMANSVISAFEGIGGKTSTDAFTTLYAIGTGSANEKIREAAVKLTNRGRDIWAYVDVDTYLTLSSRIYATGGTPITIGGDQLAAELGVTRVIPWKYFGGTTKAVLITPDLYYRVGGEPFGEQSRIWLTNQEAYRAEIFAAGGIAGLNSTAVITA